jgi:small subunit ribosomal protein S20
LKGAQEVANHKSALKRWRQNEIRRMRNKIVRTNVKTSVKAVRLAVDETPGETAVEKLNQAQSIIDRAAKKGVIHKSTAARKISRLTKAVNAANA